MHNGGGRAAMNAMAGAGNGSRNGKRVITPAGFGVVSTVFGLMRKYYPGTSTEPSHMPTRHEKHHKWSPGRLMNWGKDIGPDVLIWVKQRLNEKAHPEQAYRVCLGLLNLSRSYDNQRLNRACQIANKKSLNRLKNIRSILTSNLDKLPTDRSRQEEFELEEMLLPQSHKNIRGPKDYH